MAIDTKISASYGAPQDRDTQTTKRIGGAVTLTISRANFFRFQFGIVTLLVALSAFHYIYSDIRGQDLIAKATNMFDLGLENSIPTAFACGNLLIASGLAFFLFRHNKSLGEPKAFYWMILSLLFLILGTDEVAGIHERVSKLQEYTGRVFPVTEDYAWLPYGVAFVCVVFVFFLPFLRQLKPHTAILMILSGAIFVAGAVGFEFLNGWLLFRESIDSEDLIFYIIKLFEEGFELYAIALFNCTLFACLASDNFGFKVRTTS